MNKIQYEKATLEYLTETYGYDWMMKDEKGIVVFMKREKKNFGNYEIVKEFFADMFEQLEPNRAYEIQTLLKAYENTERHQKEKENKKEMEL